jgi:hypothetical protein
MAGRAADDAQALRVDCFRQIVLQRFRAFRRKRQLEIRKVFTNVAYGLSFL